MRLIPRPVSIRLRRWLLHRVQDEDRDWTERALRQLGPSGRPAGVSFRDAVWALRRGFLPERVHVLALRTRPDLDHVITDLERHRVHQASSKRTFVTEDKLLFSVLFSDLRDGPYPLLGAVVEGEFQAVGTGASGVPGLLSLLDDGPLVMKPATASGHGRGILILEGQPSSPMLNGRRTSASDLWEALPFEDVLVVTKRAQQGRYAERITPGQVSNVRLLTVRDEQDQPYLAWAAHEFSTRASASSNDFGSGGLSAEIDRETGRLGPAVALAGRNRVMRHPTHPDTGEQIEDVLVPHWPRVKMAVLELAARVPQLRLAGWDVIVTEDGPIVLEGERHALTSAQQCRRGLLADPIVARFFHREGLIAR